MWIEPVRASVLLTFFIYSFVREFDGKNEHISMFVQLDNIKFHKKYSIPISRNKFARYDT